MNAWSLPITSAGPVSCNISKAPTVFTCKRATLYLLSHGRTKCARFPGSRPRRSGVHVAYGIGARLGAWRHNCVSVLQHQREVSAQSATLWRCQLLSCDMCVPVTRARRVPRVPMEGSCEYTEQAVADSRQGVVLQLGGFGEVLTTAHSNNVSCYEPFVMVWTLALW